VEFFLFTTTSRLTKAHLASHPMGTVVSYPSGEAVSHEADHSPHLVPRLRIRGSIYASTSQYMFMGCCFITHRGNFTFTFGLVLVQI